MVRLTSFPSVDLEDALGPRIRSQSSEHQHFGKGYGYTCIREGAVTLLMLRPATTMTTAPLNPAADKT